MTPENKRLFKFWAKNFGSFLLWVVSGIALGTALRFTPIEYLPYAIMALVLAIGAYWSLSFARSDMALDEMRQRRIMEALAKEPRD